MAEHVLKDKTKLSDELFEAVTNVVCFQSLPQEIIDIVFGYVLDPNVYQLRHGSYFQLLRTCKWLRDVTYGWLDRGLTIRIVNWIAVAKLPVNLLQRTARLRVDLSDTTYFQLTSRNIVVEQLTEILAWSNKLTLVEFFVPPEYKLLPELSTRAEVDNLLMPLVKAVGSPVAVEWNPTDFSGLVDKDETVFERAAYGGREDVVRLILSKPYRYLRTENFSLGQTYGYDALQWSAMRGHTIVVQLLLDVIEVLLKNGKVDQWCRVPLLDESLLSLATRDMSTVKRLIHGMRKQPVRWYCVFE